MNNKAYRPLHPTVRLLPALALALLAGCASAPPPTAPEPVQPAPQVEPPVKPAPKPVEVRPDYPARYVVKKGDTLWDISARFLKSPWRWPEVWQNNPQIANPHLIYPGDILTLIYIDGKPVIQLQRGEPARQTVKLAPKVRVESLKLAVPTIPLDAIRPFLKRPRVTTQAELDAAPYIVASAGDHLIAASGNRIYAKGIKENGTYNYVVVRPGDVYRNPDNPDDILGYEAIHIADAKVVRFGQPATLELSNSNQEALNGDRLLPAGADQFEQNFFPRSPTNQVTGRIIAVPGGVSQIGQYQVVAINLGKQQAMRVGDVLAVYQNGETVRDPLKEGDDNMIKLPDEYAGLLMVFRVFDRVSYGLVMTAVRPMHVMDRLTNP